METARLQLRQPTESDILILRDLWKNENVRQFLGGIISDKEIDEKVISLQSHWNKYKFGECSVIDKNHNNVIGICGLHHSQDGIELSYMFYPTSWGKGLAREAAIMSIDNGFNSLKLDKIIAITQEANKKSCRLLECIGLRHVNTFKRFDATQRLYEIIQSEWLLKNE